MNRLDGCVVCLTRPPDQNQPLGGWLQAAGAQTVDMPLIEIVPLHDAAVVDRIRSVAGYDAVIVTSANAVRAFAALADKLDAASWRTKPWYAIGRATAKALEDTGVVARQGPPGADAERFSAWLADTLSPRQRLLFVQGARARTVVIKRLSEAAHQVDPCVCYDTIQRLVPEAVWSVLAQANQVLLPLFSPSAVASLLEQKPGIRSSWPETWHLIAIGNTTAAACREAGLPVAGTARTPSAESVMELMAARFGQPS